VGPCLDRLKRIYFCVATKTREQCHRAPSEAEIRELLGALSGRDHLILHMFSVLGLRPGELFALRRNDREASGELRIDESVSDSLKGNERVVIPKTEASVARVWLPRSIRVELDYWMRNMTDQRPEPSCLRRPGERRSVRITFSHVA
jgi:integrase